MRIVKSVKTVLEEAGRYDEVMEIFDEISKDKSLDSFYLTHGVAENVRITASFIKNEIQNGKTIREILFTGITNIDAFNSYRKYVEHELNAMLHNYAVDLSHRKEPDEKEMEKIRRWQIVWLINNYLVLCENEESDMNVLYIPEGWRVL